MPAHHRHADLWDSHASPPEIGGALWAFARAVSPRRGLRVDSPDGRGGWRHEYRHVAWPAEQPAGPYAVYLADAKGRYRLLVFDLDASRGPVGPDVQRLTALLDEVGAPYVLVRSGPAGGVHVWVGVPAGLDADLVATLAQAAGRWLPTLDTGMLQNPRTGCVRPPGAPHRAGGVSELFDPADVDQALAVLQVGVDELTVRQLAVRLVELAPPAVDEVTSPASRGVVVDDEWMPRLAGRPVAWEDLPGYIRESVQHLPEDTDASGHAWRVLLRLALARWSWAQVRDLAADPARSGGLEHIRTRPSGRGELRVVRGGYRQEQLLRRQWRKAVDRAAGLPQRQADDDAVAEAEALVAQVQAAADSVPARWATQAGPADRALLDAICWIVATSACQTPDAAIRRLALLAGHGRSTMSRALDRLAMDGWLVMEKAAAGRLAASWRLLPPPVAPPLTCDDAPAVQGGSQVVPPPQGRDYTTDQRDRLHARLRTFSADLFSPAPLRGLGHHLARTYAALQEAPDPLSPPELAQVTGYTPDTITRHLATLAQHRLVTRARGAWRPGRRRTLSAAAKALGCHGVQTTRACRYAVEQAVYAWWSEELTWMRAPRHGMRTGPRTHHDQVVLPVGRPGRPERRGRHFPRTAGRADYTAAANLLDPTYRPQHTTPASPPRLTPVEPIVATTADVVDEVAEAAAIATLTNVLGAVLVAS